MARARWLSLFIVIITLFSPGICLGWGTLTERLPMTQQELDTLRSLLKHYGSSTWKQSTAEIEPRRGPHPTHQFIVRQAYMLLEKDPACKGGPWQLPALNSVLAWDGIVRRNDGSGGHDGMWERTSAGTGPTAIYAPAKGPIGGPSADAEITADGKWNPEYNGAYHYWNPWLKCGAAPEGVGQCYAALVDAITRNGDENAKAKAASHMGHYLADVICPKHADMIALNAKTLKDLTGYANDWFVEHDRTPMITLSKWLESGAVTNAVNTIVKASGQKLTSPYWKRVDAHIGDSPLLKPNNAWSRYGVDVAEPSLRASVAGMLAALHERPADKDLVRFYGFFDPFYYNGQMVMTYQKAGDGSVHSIPQFGLTTPGSEHLMWEANPAISRYTSKNTNTMIRGTVLENSYVAFPAMAGLWSADPKQRKAAYKKSSAEFTRRAGIVQHGKNPLGGDDFVRENHPDSIRLSVKYIFSALRACVTAIRCEASYAYFPEEKKYRVYCDLGNVADEKLQVKTIRVLWATKGKLLSRDGWVKKVSCSVAKDALQRVTVELPGEGVTDKEPRFFVDITGRYDKTPDLGFWQGEVSQRPSRIMHGMSLPAFDRVSGALDLAICFDVTGSMGSSINNLRDNAIAILGKLDSRLGDLRVSLVSFRDMKTDKEKAFSVLPFTTDLNKVVAQMKGWKAQGGGDTPEDQLQAIRLALDMWGKAKNDPRKPTKIVVVITDAPPHDPDSKGNTQASIADYAERVDPAHIYPIVVRSNSKAHSKAAELAKMTGGEVLSAKSGEEVANLLAAAVDKAMVTHGQSGAPAVPSSVLFYGGLGAVIVGSLWIIRESRKRPRL